MVKRKTFQGKDKCQQFTAIGKISDDIVYPVQMENGMYLIIILII